ATMRAACSELPPSSVKSAAGSTAATPSISHHSVDRLRSSAAGSGWVIGCTPGISSVPERTVARSHGLTGGPDHDGVDVHTARLADHPHHGVGDLLGGQVVAFGRPADRAPEVGLDPAGSNQGDADPVGGHHATGVLGEAGHR